jgi:hypothetical protein
MADAGILERLCSAVINDAHVDAAELFFDAAQRISDLELALREEQRRFAEHLEAWRVNSATSLERIEDLQRQLAARPESQR